jgi:hypothetical protein
MRFYLDDDVYSPRIIEACRRLSLDITGADEAGYRGVDDAAHLTRAALMGCCIVTRNYRDFVCHTHEFQLRGFPHAGVLLVPKSLPNEAFGALARALKAYADAHPNGLPPYMIDFLTPAAD